MHKVYKFMAKHRIPSMILLVFIICPLYTYLLWSLEAPLGLIVFLNLLLFFSIIVSVNNSVNYVLKKPLDELNNKCDPLPLLMESQVLLNYKNTKVVGQVLLMNYSVALSEIGELQKNYDILKSINIDELSATLPIHKLVYYHNLSDACDSIGDAVQADIWYQKMMQIYNSMPDNKFKKQAVPVVNQATAVAWYRRGDFNQALNVLKCVQPNDLRQRVSMAMLCAQIFIKLNDFDTAKANLQFVVANGNKLFLVNEAHKLLQICDTSQPLNSGIENGNE